MQRKSSTITSRPSIGIVLALRIAMLLPLLVTSRARGDDTPEFDLVLGSGESRTIVLSVPRWNPPLPPATPFAQVVSITACPDNVVSLDPNEFKITAQGDISVNVTGMHSGVATITPNSLPQTNLLVAVALAHAEIVGDGCGYDPDDNKLYKGLCGATNLIGGYGTLQVHITPGDLGATLKINGRKHAFENGVAYKPLDSLEPQDVVVDVSGKTIYTETLTPTAGCHDGSEGRCCGCETCGKEPGDIDADNGCALVFMYLGWIDANNSNGQLVFHKPTGPLGTDRSDFVLIAPDTVHAEYDSGGRLQSVSTDTHHFILDDIADGLCINVINSAQQAMVAQCFFTNPGGDTNRLEIAGGRLGEPRYFGFAWAPDTESLSFRRGATNGADRIVETHSGYTNLLDHYTVEKRVTDADGTLVRFTTTEYIEIGGVLLPYCETVHPDPVASEWDFNQTWVDYYDDPGHSGSYRKVKYRQKLDGFFEKYVYDDYGRVVEHYTPWGPEGRRATFSGYVPVAGSGDAGSIEPYAVRQVVEKVDGNGSGNYTETSRSYTAYRPESGQPMQYRVIRERAAAAGAAFGAPGNLRDETVYWWTNAPAHLQGRPVLTIGSDGRRTRYEYETGGLLVTYNPSNPASCTMTYTNGGIAVLRTLAIEGTALYPDGIPGKTTVEVTLSDLAWGQTYLSERYVRTGSANPADPPNLLERTLTFYDAGRHPVLTLNADGTYTESTWGCCGQESETGRDGIATDFAYDGQRRLSIRSDSSPSFLPGSPGGTTTAYTYDALGRTLGTTRSAPGQIPLATRDVYNLEGRHIEHRNEAGIGTWTEWTPLWVSAWWRRDYVGYDINTYIAVDGSTDMVDTFINANSDIRIHRQEFGRYYDTHGRLYESVYESGGWYMRDDPDYPGFEASRTCRDFLGRVVSEAVPAYGGLRETLHTFDASGRRIRTDIKVGASTTQRTLYRYDFLGNLALTCQDINLNGIIDLDGPDRVSGQFSSYEYRAAESLHGQSVAAGWWRVAGSFVYPEENGSTPLTNGLSRTRVSGLGQAGTYGLLTGESVAVDALGNATLSREYLDRDAHRTVRWTRSPDSVQPDIAFMIAGHTVSNITRSGVATHYEYDAFGRQTAAWSQSGNGARTVATYTHYNAKGQVDWTEDAAGNRTSYAYDHRGRRNRTTDAMNQTTHTEYTDDGKVHATWGAAYPVAYDYDAWGRMIAMATTRDPALADSHLWSLLGYDMFLTDTDDPAYPPELDTTLWHYDLPTGLLTGKTYADGQGPSYSYTPDGQLVTRTWARGVTTSYTYTNGSSLAAIDYSDETPSVSFTMDRLGRHKSITDATGTRAFTYNDALQLAAETNALAVLSRTYDALGRPYGYQVTASEATAQAVSYAYSDMGRFSSLSSGVPSGSNTWNYSRLANSDLISGWSNGIIGTVKYFEGNRDLITQLRHAAGGTLISQFDYQNDQLGRRTRRLDTGSAVATNLFAYDTLNQLTNAVMQTNVFTWVLDPIGNRMSAASNSVIREYAANALNQYAQITNGGIRNLAYDWDGNLTNDSVFAYVWDGENRLVGVNGGGVEVSHKYDFMSRRVEKVVNGVTNQFIYDGWNLVAETSSSGVTNCYVWGADLSASMQGAGGIGGLLAVIRNGETYYPVADANGNITDYVDTNGAIVAHREFDAYGNILAATGPMVDDFNFWFSSKYLDHETGLYYFGYRYYSPVMERWMNRDPIGEDGGVHLYAYVWNLPIHGLDVLGLSDLAFIVGGNLKDEYGLYGASGDPNAIFGESLLATQVSLAIEAYKNSTGLDCKLSVEYKLSSAQDPMNLARAKHELSSPAGNGPDVIVMIFHGKKVKNTIINPKTGRKEIFTGETGVVLIDQVKEVGFAPLAVGRPYPLGEIFTDTTVIANSIDEIYVSCCFSKGLKFPVLKNKKFFFLTSPTDSKSIGFEALGRIQLLVKELCCRKTTAESPVSADNGDRSSLCCPADFTSDK